MDDVYLTSDADFMLCELYRKYLERRNEGIDKGEAAMFGSARQVKIMLKLGWSEADVASALSELADMKLLSIFNGDCTVIESQLSNKGICYMDGKFKRKIESILEYVSKLRAIILP